MNLESIKHQLSELENRTGIIILPNGTPMRGINFIDLYYKLCVIEVKKDKPLISDFLPEDQERIRGLSLWEPDPNKSGAVAVYLAEQCKIIVNTSLGISI